MKAAREAARRAQEVPELAEIGGEASRLLDQLAIDVETAEAIVQVNGGSNIPTAGENWAGSGPRLRGSGLVPLAMRLRIAA